MRLHLVELRPPFRQLRVEASPLALLLLMMMMMVLLFLVLLLHGADA